jgi:pimeloyl-ACP methyl ester carboxylesterase
MSNIFNQIKYQYSTNLININGYKVAFVDEGNSENVLLFIHGLGSYLKAWDRNIPDLKKYFRCIAIDLPGYGKSGKIIHSGKVDFYTNILYQFINKLNLTNVSLCGHSMGGQIALSYVINYPKQINKLILTAPAGFETFTDNDIERLKKIISPDIIFNTSDKQIRINFEQNFYVMPPETEEMILDRTAIKTDPEFYNHCTVVSNSLLGLLKQPVFDRLTEIQTSTLILFGLEDLLIPNRSIHLTTTKEIGTLGASKIKNSKLVFLEKCGHFVQFEKPELFNQEVVLFLL